MKWELKRATTSRLFADPDPALEHDQRRPAERVRRALAPGRELLRGLGDVDLLERTYSR